MMDQRHPRSSKENVFVGLIGAGRCAMFAVLRRWDGPCWKRYCANVFQDPKLREVLGFGKGNNVEGKLVTIVHGNDLVNISFLNFQAMQEDAAKVKQASTFP